MTTPSYEDAYQAIKNLETDTGALPLPPPTATVYVGSIDQQTGNVTYAVPTFVQTIAEPPPPLEMRPPPPPPHLDAVLRKTRIGGGGGDLGSTDGGVGVNIGPGNPGNPTQPPYTPPVQNTVAIVQTNAVNLTVSFDVTGATSSTGVNENARLATVSTGVNTGINTTLSSTGNVTITGYPTTTQGSTIYVNVGLATSSMLNTPHIDPAMSTVPLQLSVSGQISFVYLAIIRPPVLGVGGFTMPALPIGIIFAPPQGVLKKQKRLQRQGDVYAVDHHVVHLEHSDEDRPGLSNLGCRREDRRSRDRRWGAGRRLARDRRGGGLGNGVIEWLVRHD